ncbi:MAG: alpha/beta fold hydrolase [Polyangiaceae bacterium]|jgi:predicted alpha/beta hydrolase
MTAERFQKLLSSSESIEIRTSDAWSLRADVREPHASPVGVAVLAHALMARRSEFERPRGAGLALFLAERGWRTVAFDFRGHGDSAFGKGSLAYDDFVGRDLPAVCDFARWHGGERMRVVVVGHSLGGHVALASAASGAIDVEAIVGIGASVWIRELEPSWRRFLAKRVVVIAASAAARRFGRMPARWLRLGSDDVPAGVVADIARFARTGRWTSADASLDYLRLLAHIRTPVLEVVSDGDRFECHPACGERFAARCGARHDVLRVRYGDRGAPAPDHMGLVTSDRVRTVWQQIESWARAIVARS